MMGRPKQRRGKCRYWQQEEFAAAITCPTCKNEADWELSERPGNGDTFWCNSCRTNFIVKVKEVRGRYDY
jgi:hypothetical protein